MSRKASIAKPRARVLPDQAMQDEDQTPIARNIFVAASAFVLVAFVLAQVVVGANANGPAEQAKKLMAQIRAEVVDVPLTTQQLEWPLETADGVRVLSQMPPDTVIFLNFWATWCEPCREELPSMMRLRQAMAGKRFMMVAVSYDEKWSDVRDFFQNWVGRVPTDSQVMLLKDPQLEEGATLRETFGTTQLPDSYVIFNRKVVARFVNARNWTDPSVVDYFNKITPELEAER